jgi:hypothetical protein
MCSDANYVYININVLIYSLPLQAIVFEDIMFICFPTSSYYDVCSRDSVVGIATGYGLDD